MTIKRDDLTASGIPKTAVERVVAKLRSVALSCSEGHRLGNEEDLLSLLGVSRPTFRQAARIVQHERLIASKRGVGGGFYVTRPPVEDAVQAPAILLQLQSISLEQVVEAAEWPLAEAARLACMRGTPEEKARLLSWAGKTFRPSLSPKQAIAADIHLRKQLGEMSRNPAVNLFVEISYAFGSLETRSRILEYYRNQIRTWSEATMRLVEGIAAGEMHLVVPMSRYRTKLLAVYLASRPSDGAEIEEAAKRIVAD